jgi:hypothetical protein
MFATKCKDNTDDQHKAQEEEGATRTMKDKGFAAAGADVENVCD